MPCHEVVLVLEPPNPMSLEEFENWESVNRPENMLWLERVEPVGPLPAAAFRCVYQECDEAVAELCS